MERILTIQNFILDGLENGWVQNERDDQIHIAMYLRGLHDVIVSMLSPAVDIKITNWVATQNSDLGYPGYEVLGNGSFESRSSLSRTWILVFAYWLIQDWPARLVLLLQETGLPASSLQMRRKSSPAWMFANGLDHVFGRFPERTPEEVLSAQNVLSRLRRCPPNKADLATFMRTGIAPPIQGLSRPASPIARQIMDEEREYFSRKAISNRDFLESQRERSRELYPPLQLFLPIDDFLQDADDTDATLAAIKRSQY